MWCRLGMWNETWDFHASQEGFLGVPQLAEFYDPLEADRDNFDSHFVMVEKVDSENLFDDGRGRSVFVG